MPWGGRCTGWARANLALAYYMRKHGVYMPELHTLRCWAAVYQRPGAACIEYTSMTDTLFMSEDAAVAGRDSEKR